MKIDRYIILCGGGDGSAMIDEYFNTAEEADEYLEEMMGKNPEDYSMNDGWSSATSFELTDEEMEKACNLYLAETQSFLGRAIKKEDEIVVMQDGEPLLVPTDEDYMDEYELEELRLKQEALRLANLNV
jgi:hypothetical protein